MTISLLAIFLMLICLPGNLLGQHLGAFGEVATSTFPELKNHRGIGLTYLRINESGKTWHITLSKGYSSFKDDQGDLFYGNRVALSSTWQKLLTGSLRQGLYIGGGLGLDFYYASIILTPTLNPVAMVQLQYLETNVLHTPLSVFVAAKPKASIGFNYLLNCYDCYTPYGNPMLLLELNAGIMYNFSKKKNQYKYAE